MEGYRSILAIIDIFGHAKVSIKNHPLKSSEGDFSRYFRFGIES
jgi:hypothetical protein